MRTPFWVEGWSLYWELLLWDRKFPRNDPERIDMIGGLQLRSLAHELVDGKKMSLQEFHDKVLLGGPMPIELVRARLGGQALTRDMRSTWRFYPSAPSTGAAAAGR